MIQLKLQVFYLEKVEKEGGCPVILRTDNGTENTLIAAVQSYFCCDGHDEHAGTKAHIYGSSHSNQRIECWWSSFRKSRSNWWINFFKDNNIIIHNLYSAALLKDPAALYNNGNVNIKSIR